MKDARQERYEGCRAGSVERARVGVKAGSVWRLVLLLWKLVKLPLWQPAIAVRNLHTSHFQALLAPPTPKPRFLIKFLI